MSSSSESTSSVKYRNLERPYNGQLGLFSALVLGTDIGIGMLCVWVIISSGLRQGCIFFKFDPAEGVAGEKNVKI